MASSFTQPFQANSPWNAPISVDATYRDAPGVASLLVGLSSWLPGESTSIPVYQAGSGDPLEKVLYNPDTWKNLLSGKWKNIGNTASVEKQILDGASGDFPYDHHTFVSQAVGRLVMPSSYDEIDHPDGQTLQIRAPEGVRPSIGEDGHMVVFQPDGKSVETFGTIVLSDGTVVAQSYKETDQANAKGDGFSNGVTASMLPVYAGLIRQEEYDKGEIQHAMKLVVPASLLHPSFVYPAYSFDRDAMTSNPSYSGSLSMGTRLGLPRDLDLAELGLDTKFGRIVAEAAQKHGFIVTDRGGTGITIITETGITTPDLDNYQWQRGDDLQTIFDNVKRVSPDIAGGLAGKRSSDQEAGSGSADLDIRIKASADLYNGAPIMKIDLGGKFLGQTIVQADHSMGQSAIFTFRADGASPGRGEDLRIAFTNDAWGGSADQDRNLWIEAVTVNGQDIAIENAVYDKDTGIDIAGVSQMQHSGALVFDL